MAKRNAPQSLGNTIPPKNLADMQAIELNPWQPQQNPRLSIDPEEISKLLQHINTEPEQSLTQALLLHLKKQKKTPEARDDLSRLTLAFKALYLCAKFKQIKPEAQLKFATPLNEIAQQAYRFYANNATEIDLEIIISQMESVLTQKWDQQLEDLQHKLAWMPKTEQAQCYAQFSKCYWNAYRRTLSPRYALLEAIETSNKLN